MLPINSATLCLIRAIRHSMAASRQLLCYSRYNRRLTLHALITVLSILRFIPTYSRDLLRTYPSHSFGVILPYLFPVISLRHWRRQKFLRRKRPTFRRDRWLIFAAFALFDLLVGDGLLALVVILLSLPAANVFPALHMLDAVSLGGLDDLALFVPFAPYVYPFRVVALFVPPPRVASLS